MRRPSSARSSKLVLRTAPLAWNARWIFARRSRRVSSCTSPITSPVYLSRISDVLRASIRSILAVRRCALRPRSSRGSLQDGGPVRDDDDAVGLDARRAADHEEPLAVRRHVVRLQVPRQFAAEVELQGEERLRLAGLQPSRSRDAGRPTSASRPAPRRRARGRCDSRRASARRRPRPAASGRPAPAARRPPSVPTRSSRTPSNGRPGRSLGAPRRSGSQRSGAAGSSGRRGRGSAREHRPATRCAHEHVPAVGQDRRERLVRARSGPGASRDRRPPAARRDCRRRTGRRRRRPARRPGTTRG